MLIRWVVNKPADKVFKLQVVEAEATTTFSSTNQFGVFLPTNQTIDNRPWFIIAYEVWMYFGARSKMTGSTIDDDVLKNAIVESAIVHARILCDIFLSKKTQWGGGISLKELLRDDWKSDRLKDLTSKVRDLRQAYGNHKTAGSPNKVFHQKALHADQDRYPTFQGYDYSAQFKALDPAIRGVVDALQAIHPLFVQV